MPLRATIRPAFLSVISGLGLVMIGSRASAATVTLSVADGARIADTTTVTARIVGFEATGVRKVEFTVDGRPRGEDVSTPYTLEWDTLQDAEGEHTVEAVATDMQGATASTVCSPSASWRVSHSSV